MRRAFQLSEEDKGGLAALGRPWEAVVENRAKWLILPDYPIPEGYNHRVAAAAIRIPPSYPDDQIDMVYFHPALALVSGKGTRNSASAHSMGNSISNGRATGQARIRGGGASTASAPTCCWWIVGSKKNSENERARCRLN